VLAPAYPGLDVEVEALNRDPSPIERLTVPAIMTRLETVVGGLEAPPILMGHSAATYGCGVVMKGVRLTHIGGPG
jgi:hypothetical protein